MRTLSGIETKNSRNQVSQCRIRFVPRANDGTSGKLALLTMGQCACSKLRLARRKSKRPRNNVRDPPGRVAEATRREEQHLKPRSVIERLVSEIVRRSTSLFSSDPNAEAPSSLLLLRRMSSESDEALIEIQLALVRCIPLDVSTNPFGANLLVLVLDECSLFSQDVLSRLIRELHLSTFLSETSQSTCDPARLRRTQVRRNICVMIGTLAEKLAGPNSAALCTEEILKFLFDAIADCSLQEHLEVSGQLSKAARKARSPCENEPYHLDSARLSVILHSLIALEKLSHSNTANKEVVVHRIFECNALAHLRALVRIVRNELQRFHSHSPCMLSFDPLFSFCRLTPTEGVSLDVSRWVSIAQLSRMERDWLADLRQVCFQCEWLLDNVFVRDELLSLASQSYRLRPDSAPLKNVTVVPEALPQVPTVNRVAFRYQLVDYSRVHARMRNNDLSEYAKLDPLGFELRSDHNGFETVRANCAVQRVHSVCNAYYFEVLLLTNGIMQIGWSTPSGEFHSREGFGVGDDSYSIAFDGCRQLIWYEAKAAPCCIPRSATCPPSRCPVHSPSLPPPSAPDFTLGRPACSCFATDCGSAPSAHAAGDPESGWKAGDVLGSLLDLDNSTVAFFINGVEVTRVATLFVHTNRDSDEYFAAASLMSFQQAIFNLGQFPFLYTPGPFAFRSFFEAARVQFETVRNDRERLNALEQRVVLPRPLLVRVRLRQQLEPTPGSIGNAESPRCAVCFETLHAKIKCRLAPCGHADICMSCALQCEQCPFCRTAIDDRTVGVTESSAS